MIFGVAIATALMPPLCTVGYALANSNIPYALGALYLFSINAIFIALAAYLVVKILRFPMTEYANPKSRHRISRLATLLALLMAIPAGFTFVDVLVSVLILTIGSCLICGIKKLWIIIILPSCLLLLAIDDS